MTGNNLLHEVQKTSKVLNPRIITTTLHHYACCVKTVDKLGKIRISQGAMSVLLQQ